MDTPDSTGSGQGLPTPAAHAPGAARHPGRTRRPPLPPLPNPPAPDGLLVVDKPAGMTSHDVVSRVRRMAHTRRVGHAGTLDPGATGVLVVGIGRATRLLTHVTGHDKAYDATMRLGVGTTTDDAEGEVTAAPGCPGLTDGALEAALAPLRGDIEQAPSSVSAIRIEGRRAHELVREGVAVEIPARPVHVAALTVTSPPRPATVTVAGTGEVPVLDVDLHVECSSGTYVRALARDVGRALGCGAHLTALRRTRVGSLDLGDAHPLADLLASAEAGEVLPVTGLDEAARSMFPALVLEVEEARRFADGAAPHRDHAEVGDLARAAGEGPIAALDPDGSTVLGLVRVEGTPAALRTVLVFGGRR